MSGEGEVDQGAMLRGIIESVAAGDISRSDNVAQLLVAAITHVRQSMLTAQGAQVGPSQSLVDVAVPLPAPGGQGEGEETSTVNFSINPQIQVNSFTPSGLAELGDGAGYGESGGAAEASTPSSSRPKPICVKFPIELRKQIIARRKEGKKSKDIAKELKVSVSGVQKVWERFLATGMVHDRRPSTYAGRPKKYTYTQDNSLSPTFEAQYLGDGNVEVFQTSGAHIEYVGSATPLSEEGGHTNAVVISGDSDVFTEEPMDAPGATVEVVATPPSLTPGAAQARHKGAPAYREELLLRLIEGCPLACLREMSDADSNPHVLNLALSVNRPLYLEYVLGHPFGKVPAPRPYDANYEEAKIILTDPIDPIGKTVLARLGYTTMVYFNACCQPSPLFDPQKLLTSLPLSLGPGHILETMQSTLQYFIDISLDPVAALERIPIGSGPSLAAQTQDGEIVSHGFPPPSKLSEYWQQMYSYASLLECCENFLSATVPSAPCLLCHPFESFAKQLEIRDADTDLLSPSTSSTSLSRLSPHTLSHDGPEKFSDATFGVEVQVLQSGVADRSEQVAPPTGHAQPHSRSKGRPRKTASRRSSAAGELQQQVLIDGHFEVPVEEEVPSVVSIALHSSSSLSSTTDRETAASDPHSSTIVGVASSVSTRMPSDVGVAPPASCLPVVLIPWVDQDEAASKSALLTALNAAGVSHTSGEGSHGTGIIPVHDTGISPVRGTDEGAVSPRPSKAVPSETSATRLAPLPAKLAASEDNGRVEPSPSPPAAAHRALPDPTSVGSGEGTGVEATGHEKERDRSGEGGQRSRKSRRRDSPTASPQTRQSARKSTPLKSVTSLKDTSPSSPRLRARPGSEGLPSESKLKGARRDASLSLPPAKRTRRAVAAAAGNSGQDGARLAQEVMSPERKGAESGTRGPMAWSVAEVAEFVSSVPNCGYMEEVFRSHEVDGECLVSLDPELLVKLMGLKTGPALRIHRKIVALKRQFGIP